MQPILNTSFDVVAAIRVLAARIEALEEHCVPAPAVPADEVQSVKPPRPPKAKSETLEVIS